MGVSFLNTKTKQRLTYLTILVYNFFTGVDYAIIFPTIWSYIHERFGGQTAMLGIIIAIYNLASFISSPIVGWWNDKSSNTRFILLLTIIMEIVGNIMYFMGIATWFLTLSRLIAGIGWSAGAAVYADITRSTTEEERTSVFSVIIAAREIGFFFGPAFNFFLSKANFSIFSFPVDKFTAPGLFMAFIWFILEIIIFFFYYDLIELKDNEDIEHLFENFKKDNSQLPDSIPYSDLDNSTSLEHALTSSYPAYYNPLFQRSLSRTSQHSTSEPNIKVEWFEDNAQHFNIHNKEEIQTIHCKKACIDFNSLGPDWLSTNYKSCNGRAGSISDKMIESAERLIQSTSESYGNNFDILLENRNPQDMTSRHTSSGLPSTPYSSSAPPSLPDEKTSLLSKSRQTYNIFDEHVVILFLAFVAFYSQTALETIITPIGQKYYTFTESDNSWIFFLAGSEVIFVFWIIKCVSFRVSDRSILLVGLIASGIASGLPIFFIPTAVPGEMKTLPFFIITIIIDMVGFATLIVCTSSLLTKLTSDETQAFFHGVRRSMGSLGCILGPLWGGAFLPYLYVLFAIPFMLILLSLVLFMCSYKKLRVNAVES